MIRALALLLVLAAHLSAATSYFQVDEPDRWFDPVSSHHWLHAAGGAVIGAAVFTVASTQTESRTWRYGSALVAGIATATAWELIEADRGIAGQTKRDPVDIAWTTLGTALGAIVADTIGQDIALIPRHDGGAVALAWRF